MTSCSKLVPNNITKALKPHKKGIIALNLLKKLMCFCSIFCRKKPTPEAQPDNRDGNEICIGVLNNFYADGIKWHDVACHHKKPTICEL